MSPKNLHTFITYALALVWFVNGFFCKILNLAPRHEQIVSKIFGAGYSSFFIIHFIGFMEIMMAVWILSKYKSRLNAYLQIVLVGTMNIIEFVLVPDLLLWGRFNAIFALAFILLVYCNECILNKKLAKRH